MRLSEVTDWEEGGRTSSHAAARLFSKEAAEGLRQVLVARREGALGVSWADNGGDNQPQAPPAQDLSTVEAVLALLENGGSMHASLLHLLDKQSQQPEEGSGFSSSKDVDAGVHGSMVQLLQALHLFVYG